MPLVACVQLNCTDDREGNLDRAEKWIRLAASQGAGLVATPENTSFIGAPEQKLAMAEPVNGPTFQRFADLAAELGIYLLIGSLPEVGEGAEEGVRYYNSSPLFGPDGELLSWYRKLHLFDANVPGGISVQESRFVVPGSQAVLCWTPFGRLGFSICYDLRFPELYRTLLEMGADILAVPSAFTQETGRDHWEILLRARAIENQCWVLAPGQWGPHGAASGGLRHSHGNSMIVDPWGAVVARCPDGEGVITAEIDLERVHRIREGMPVQQHRIL